MIQPTTDRKYFRQIADFIPKIKDVDYTPREFIVFLLKNFDERTFRIWIDLEGEKVKSFLIAEIVKPLIEDEVFIPLSYVSNGKGKEFYDRVEGWARIKGIRKISAYIRKGERGLEKKYGFKREFICVVKKLTY